MCGQQPASGPPDKAMSTRRYPRASPWVSTALALLVMETYVRDLSTRDIKRMFLEAMTHQVLYRSGVSMIASQLQVDLGSPPLFQPFVFTLHNQLLLTPID